MNHPPEVKITKKDFLCCFVLIVGWVIPIIYTGLTHRKILLFPSAVRYFQTIGDLFTHRVQVWPMPYIQIRTEANPGWMTLPEEDFFRLKTFGYRTRLFEVLYYATNVPDYERKSHETQAELAQWIAKRYTKLYPGNPKPVAVRFVAGLHFADPQNPPQGHWQPPSYEAFPKDKTYILSTHDVRTDHAH